MGIFSKIKKIVDFLVPEWLFNLLKKYPWFPLIGVIIAFILSITIDWGKVACFFNKNACVPHIQYINSPTPPTPYYR